MKKEEIAPVRTPQEERIIEIIETESISIRKRLIYAWVQKEKISFEEFRNLLTYV